MRSRGYDSRALAAVANNEMSAEPFERTRQTAQWYMPDGTDSPEPRSGVGTTGQRSLSNKLQSQKNAQSAASFHSRLEQAGINTRISETAAQNLWLLEDRARVLKRQLSIAAENRANFQCLNTATKSVLDAGIREIALRTEIAEAELQCRYFYIRSREYDSRARNAIEKNQLSAALYEHTQKTWATYRPEQIDSTF
jgi:hypothetical protein